MRRSILLRLLGLFLFGFTVLSTQAAIYRSKATGNWGTAGTWETSTLGVIWNNAVTAPSAADEVRIQGGHTITVNVNGACTQITFDNYTGGNAAVGLIVNTGITLNIGGAVTCAQSGDMVITINGTGAVIATGGFSLSAATGNLNATIGSGGKFEFGGAWALNLSNNKSYSIANNGSVKGSTVTMDGGNGNSTISLSGTGAYLFSGLCSINAIVTFTINGSFQSAGMTNSGADTKIFGGTGTYNLGAVSLGGNGSNTFTIPNSLTATSMVANGAGDVSFAVNGSLVATSFTGSGNGNRTFTGSGTLSLGVVDLTCLFSANLSNSFTATSFTTTNTDAKSITGAATYSLGAVNIAGVFTSTISGSCTATSLTTSSNNAKSFGGTGAYSMGAVNSTGQVSFVGSGSFAGTTLTFSDNNNKAITGTGPYSFSGAITMSGTGITINSSITGASLAINTAATTIAGSGNGRIVVSGNAVITSDAAVDITLRSLHSSNTTIMNSVGSVDVYDIDTIYCTNVLTVTNDAAGACRGPQLITNRIETGGNFVINCPTPGSGQVDKDIDANTIVVGGSLNITGGTYNVALTAAVSMAITGSVTSTGSDVDVSSPTTTVTGNLSFTGTTTTSTWSGNSLAVNGSGTTAGGAFTLTTFTIGSGLTVTGGTTNTNTLVVTTLGVTGNTTMTGGQNTWTINGTSNISGNLSISNGNAGQQNLITLNGVLTVAGTTGLTLTSTITNATIANLINIGSATTTGGLTISNNDLVMVGNSGANLQNSIDLFRGDLTIVDDISLTGVLVNNRIRWNDVAPYNNLTKTFHFGGNVNDVTKGSLTMNDDATPNAPFTTFFEGTKKQTIPGSDNWQFKRIDVTNVTDSVIFGGTLSRASSRLTGRVKVYSNAKLCDEFYDFGGTGHDSIEIETNGMFVLYNLTQQFPNVVENLNISNDGIVYFLNNSGTTQQILGGSGTTKSLPTVKVGGSGIKAVQNQIDTVANRNQIQFLSVEGGTLTFGAGGTVLAMTNGTQSVTQKLSVASGATLDFPIVFTRVPTGKFDFNYNSTLSYTGAALAQQVYSLYKNGPNWGELADIGNLTIGGSGNKSISAGDSVKYCRKLSVTGAFVIGNGSVCKAISNASYTAWVGPVTGSISYTGTGKFVAQRYVALADVNYRDYASPIKLTTLANWHYNGLEIVGIPGAYYFPNAPGYYPGYGVNAYNYNETSTGDLESGFEYTDGSGSATTSYVNTLSGSNIVKGGYRIYGGRDAATYEITLRDSGQLYTGDIVLQPTFTHAGSDSRVADDGWNFFGNPYMAGIDWVSLYNTNRTSAGGQMVSDDNVTNGITPVLYVYMPSDRNNAGGYSNYGSFNAVTSANIGLSDGLLPAFQGFWVKTYHASSASTTFNLTLKETQKYEGAGTYHKSEKSSGPEMAMINITDPFGGKDQVGLHYWEKAKMGVDMAFDILKFSADAYGTTLAIQTPENEDLWVNAIPKNKVEYKIDLKLEAAYSGQHSVDWTNLDAIFSQFNCVQLYDNLTGESVNMKETTQYVFQSEEGYSGKRFTITAIRMIDMAESITRNTSCVGAENGYIRLDLSDYQSMDHNFTMYRRGNNQQLINTYVGNVQYIKEALPAGDYSLVNNNSIAGCGESEYFFSILDPNPVVANFEVSQSLIEAGKEVEFTNKSTGAVNYVWFFSDDMSTSEEINPIHEFQTPGTFEVILKATNADPGCRNTTTQLVTVSEPSAIGNATKNADVTIVAVRDGIKLINPSAGMVEVSVYSTNGQLVKTATIEPGEGMIQIERTGTYSVNVKGENFNVTKMVVVL